jgi:hypothetical protein
MAAGRPNSKGMLPNGKKAKGGTFTMFPHAIQDHHDYCALSLGARAFLLDFMRQYNGRNNGNLAASEGVMGKYGYSKRQCMRYRNELKKRGWIEVTRYPRWPRDPYLYRVTWREVDEWEGLPVLEVGARQQRPRSLR